MPGALHLPVPVARVAGHAVVQVPVSQGLLFIEDKLLQLHLHFRAGHSAWRGRERGRVTGGSSPGPPAPHAGKGRTVMGRVGPTQDAADTREHLMGKGDQGVEGRELLPRNILYN